MDRRQKRKKLSSTLAGFVYQKKMYKKIRIFLKSNSAIGLKIIL